MAKSLSAVCGVILLAVAANVQAAPIHNYFGLLTPETTITFSEVPLADNEELSTQFAAFGVTFPPFSFLFAETNDGPLYLPNAENRKDSCPVHPIYCQPFDIAFTSPVNAAAFLMATDPGTSYFEAFLNATLVESFEADSQRIADYYGFQNIVFNRIHVLPGGRVGFAGIDNIQFTHAASVPEPATLALVGLGAISAGLRTRWRNRRSQ